MLSDRGKCQKVLIEGLHISGVRGGPLGDLTRAWLNFLRYIVAVMKTGYEC